MACGGATPPPVAPKPIPKVASGPFGALKLPATARGVWIVYRETWKTVTLTGGDGDGDDGYDPDAPKKKKPKPPVPTLQSRVLVSITTMEPGSDGVITPPDDPPLGPSTDGDDATLVRAHAIVWAPGLGVFDWDSHVFGTTPTPKKNEPLTARTKSDEPAGCESVEAVAALFRDFAPGTKTGLPRAKFVEEMAPAVGNLLGTLVAKIGDPSSVVYEDPDDASTEPSDPANKKPAVTTCEGYGPLTGAAQQKVQSIIAWALSQQHGGDYAIESEKSQPVAPPSASLDDKAKRWEAVIGWLASNQPGAKEAIESALSAKDPETRKAALILTAGLNGGGTTVGHVLPLIADPDPAVRPWAQPALDALGTPDAESVPGIVALIGSPTTDDAESNYAIDLLRRMGTAAKTAALPLVKLAKGSKDPVRARAMRGLVALGPNAADAAVQLVDLLRDDATAYAAADVFNAMRQAGAPAVPALGDALADPSNDVKTRACTALAAIGPASKPKVAVLTKLVDPASPPTLRIAAMRALGGIGSDAAGASDRVIKQLEDPSEEVRRVAVNALGQFGPKASAAVKGLTALFEHDPSNAVRLAAAESLGKLGPAAHAAVPTLMKVVETSSDEGMRRVAAYAIVDVGASSAPDVPRLVEALKKKNDYWRAQIIERTSGMGKAVVPYLTKLLGDVKDYPELHAAIVTLGQIGKDSAPAVPTMTKLLEKGTNTYDVFNALYQIGPGASAAVTPLVGFLEKNMYRWDCLRVLPRIGAPAVGPLTKLMKDEKREVGLRQDVAGAILDAGPSAAPAIKDILDLWEKAKPYWVPLDRFGKVGKAAAAPLAAGTKDARPGVKHRATQALGYLGKDAAPEAIAALVVAMKDPELHQEALDAIRRYTKDVARPILEKLSKEKDKEKEAGDALASIG